MYILNLELAFSERLAIRVKWFPIEKNIQVFLLIYFRITLYNCIIDLWLVIFQLSTSHIKIYYEILRHDFYCLEIKKTKNMTGSYVIMIIFSRNNLFRLKIFPVSFNYFVKYYLNKTVYVLRISSSRSEWTWFLGSKIFNFLVVLKISKIKIF